MINLKEIQKRIYQNKIEKGFDVENISREFCLTNEELSEAYRAYDKKLPDLGEELADVAIYLLGIAEILNIDLEKEILQKVDKNKKRVYEEIDGALNKVDE